MSIQFEEKKGRVKVPKSQALLWNQKVLDAQKRETFYRTLSSARAEIGLKYREADQFLKTLVYPMRNKEQKELIAIYSEQLVSCFKSCNTFMANMEANAPDVTLVESKHPNLCDLEEAVRLVTTLARKAIKFYLLSMQIVPLEVCAERVKINYGSVSKFGQAIRTAWCDLDFETAAVCTGFFFGGAGFGTFLAFALGLSFTGFGLLALFGGAILGMCGAAVYYKYKKHQKRKHKMEFQKAKNELKAFWTRWHSLNKVDTGDIMKALGFLKESTTSFELVSKRIFPELENVEKLFAPCSVCLEELIPHTVFQRDHLHVPVDYKAEGKDIICATGCVEHYYHFDCMRDFMEQKKFPETIACPLCRTDIKKEDWKIVYRSDKMKCLEQSVISKETLLVLDEADVEQSDLIEGYDDGFVEIDLSDSTV